MTSDVICLFWKKETRFNQLKHLSDAWRRKGQLEVFLILMFVLSHTWARHNLEFGKILFWLIDRTGSDTKYCDKNLFLALGSISISTIAPRPLPHYTVFQHPANFGTKVAQSWSYFPSNTNRESVKIMILQVVFNLKSLNVALK